MKLTHRIVLTGGPGGGKSTAADLIRRELGDHIVVVPESATLLFKGGLPRVDQEIAKAASQRAIYHTQKNMEEVQRCLYPERVLLCDRGTVDGAAYWPKGQGDYFTALETNLDDELRRYDAVVFFETAAVGDISIEGGNPVRNESNKEAVKLDHELRALWSRHPRFTLVKHETSFFKKLNCALQAVQDTLKTLNGN